MTTVQITLPDSVAREAQEAGLLNPDAIEQLLRDAMRHKAVDELFSAMDRMADANFPPMTMEEIQTQVDAVRAERRARAPRP